jgi:CRISPR-associated protein Csx10
LSPSGNWLVAPKRRIQVHNASTTPGRKAAGLSQVYRYDALAAGQTFQAIILADDDVDIKPLKKLMDQNQFVMGGAIIGGYGLVKIDKVQEHPNWSEYSAEAPENGGKYVYITCLSDVILRGKDGQLSTNLGAALGIELCEESFQSTEVVGGFNQKWGLPLPQSIAIQAGSVFKFQKTSDLAQKLNPFLERGVGERTVEGYGRIALNLHTKPVRSLVSPQNDNAFIPDVLSAKSSDLAQKMADRYLRTLLEGKLQEVVRDYASFRSLPSSTQLSRVRVTARHALAQQDLGLIVSHLNSLKGAKADWEKAKIGDDRMFEWIKEQAQLNRANFLQLFKIGTELPQIAGQTSKIESNMEVEFRARFIDGVLKQAVNHNQAASNSKRGVS